METVSYYEQPPSYDEFLRRHLMANVPAVIGPSLIAHWGARKTWVVPKTPSPQDTGTTHQPNYGYLRKMFGSCTVQVADCHDRYFTDQKRSDMTFAAFVDLWEHALDTSHSSRYYLKDWHFVHACPEIEAYTVPYLFADDWLNNYWTSTSTKEDYRFSYMGGHGTITPLHVDVFRSYSWSSNLCGIKKWTFYRPDQASLLKNKQGHYVYDIRTVDTSEFPYFHQAKSITLYQRDGETVFVPSGWFHFVENIGATISINRNWCNATNIGVLYQSLADDLSDVRLAIEDLKETMTPLEFVVQCQELLYAHSGWTWVLLIDILQCAMDRLTICPCEWQPPPVFQCQQIRSVLTRLETEENCFSDYVDSTSLDAFVRLKQTVSLWEQESKERE
ncbi:hypothetical protein BDF14DRAFT_1718672 [Spinellus fusiger]|nr:hypothetical protein BDF14DRAFT_1718672 [Spinellus fusiger]